MIGRRTLLAGLASGPAIALSAAGTVPDPINTLRKALDSVPSGPALLASYPDRGANARFPDFAPANNKTAYVYDNALAGLALLAAGDPLRAARIADALVRAQTHDPDFHDGRLRNAYRAGPMKIHHASVLAGHGLAASRGVVDLPGWWDKQNNRWAEDPYQIGSETGPVAWAILLWTTLIHAGVNIERYRAAAHRAADWIVANCRAPHGFTGGVFGFAPHQQKLRWASTEQNTDLTVAFARLHRVAEAAHAAHFVHTMREPDRSLFAAGLTPDGGRNRMIAADANLWPFLAGLARSEAIGPAIAALGRPPPHPEGIGFTAASASIWTEGTAFALLALHRAGDYAGTAVRFASTLADAVTASGYLRATSGAPVATGLTVGPGADARPFIYYPVPALAPTAWAVLASRNYNPLQR